MKIPNKNPLWKQPNPAMQLTAIRAAIEANFTNFTDDVITLSVFNDRLEEFFAQLRQLEPFLSGQKPWGPPVVGKRYIIQGKPNEELGQLGYRHQATFQHGVFVTSTGASRDFDDLVNYWEMPPFGNGNGEIQEADFTF